MEISDRQLDTTAPYFFRQWKVWASTNILANFLSRYIISCSCAFSVFSLLFTYSLAGVFVTMQVKVKVKCTLVQALRLCTGRTAHRGSRGIALPCHDHGTKRRWGVSLTHRPIFTPGKDPVPIVQEAGWAPGPAWTGEENLASTGIRSPGRPARSQSLYRLSYRTHSRTGGPIKIT